MKRSYSKTIASLLCLAVSGCGAAWEKPSNAHDLNGRDGYMAERRDMPAKPNGDAAEARRWNQSNCAADTPNHTNLALTPLPGQMALSPGDLVRITVPGDDAPSGSYKVDSDGSLALDLIGRLPVTGRSLATVEADIARRLVALKHFRPGFARVVVRLLDRSAVRVRVSGAVFQPGQVVINSRSPNESDNARQTATGDHAIGRTLSVALSSAAGVWPDADIRNVVVIQGGARRTVDLTGMLDGSAVDDVLLTDGDRVEVPSRGCFQMNLARPSPITAPGVRVFLSNLTTPAASNAQSAVGHDQTSLPYGTRFLQALVSANCVGGTQSTNADRWAVLISTNPMTGDSEVIERRIEALVRRSDRDAFNPVMLPSDAVACYDSAVTNLRDVVRAIGDITGISSVGRGAGL